MFFCQPVTKHNTEEDQIQAI